MSVMGVQLKGYRKAGRMGSGMGIGIPKEIVDKLNIKPGDEYEVKADPETGVMVITPIKKIPMGAGLTPEMEEIIEDTFKKYDKTLRNLKDR